MKMFEEFAFGFGGVVSLVYVLDILHFFVMRCYIFKYIRTGSYRRVFKLMIFLYIRTKYT